jgi:hypothetical protein
LLAHQRYCRLEGAASSLVVTHHFTHIPQQARSSVMRGVEEAGALKQLPRRL